MSRPLLSANDRRYVPLIVALSVLVPVAVVLLLRLPAIRTQLDLSIFPLANACINAAVSVLLVWGYLVIRPVRTAGLLRRAATQATAAVPARHPNWEARMQRHLRIMLTAFVLSALFLVNYVVYHALSPDQARFGGSGWVRTVYLLILVTHVVLAAVVMPFVLFTLYRGLTGEFARHRRLARYTFPVWLYVSVTGVIVYWMMAPYYTH